MVEAYVKLINADKVKLQVKFLISGENQTAIELANTVKEEIGGDVVPKFYQDDNRCITFHQIK